MECMGSPHSVLLLITIDETCCIDFASKKLTLSFLSLFAYFHIAYISSGDHKMYTSLQKTLQCIATLQNRSDTNFVSKTIHLLYLYETSKHLLWHKKRENNTVMCTYIP